jgi:hypothetical protein
MADYAYRVGQTVYLTTKRYTGAPGGAYQITKRLPREDGQFKYRIKSSKENYERTATESELSGAA